VGSQELGRGRTSSGVTPIRRQALRVGPHLARRTARSRCPAARGAGRWPANPVHAEPSPQNAPRPNSSGLRAHSGRKLPAGAAAERPRVTPPVDPPQQRSQPMSTAGQQQEQRKTFVAEQEEQRGQRGRKARQTGSTRTAAATRRKPVVLLDRRSAGVPPPPHVHSTLRRRPTPGRSPHGQRTVIGGPFRTARGARGRPAGSAPTVRATVRAPTPLAGAAGGRRGLPWVRSPMLQRRSEVAGPGATGVRFAPLMGSLSSTVAPIEVQEQRNDEHAGADQCLAQPVAVRIGE